MTKDEALKLALEALEYIEHNYMSLPKSGETAITAIREALAQPEQEPVAWFEHNPDLDAWFLAYSKNQNPGIKSRPLVFGDTAPPQRKPEQKPVAHTLNCVCGAVWDIKSDGSEEMAHTPDTTPPQRQWQGLARLELQKAVEGLEDLEDCWIAIESALREKNT